MILEAKFYRQLLCNGNNDSNSNSYTMCNRLIVILVSYNNRK